MQTKHNDGAVDSVNLAIPFVTTMKEEGDLELQIQNLPHKQALWPWTVGILKRHTT